MAKKTEKTTKEVASPKTTKHKLIKPFGKLPVGHEVNLGENGVKFYRKNKFIK